MRLGIIGLGSIGTRHARNAETLGLEVIGYDVKGLGDLEAVAACPAVMICTPVETHAVVARQLLNLGYRGPLFVEKPLALTVAECAVFQNWPHPTVQVGYQLRFHPDVWWLKDSVKHPNMADVTVSWDARKYSHGFLESSHELDLLRFLRGDVSLASVSPSNDGERLDIVFDLGATATLDIGAGANQYERRWMLGNERRHAEVEFQLSDDLGNEMYVDELKHFLVCAGEGLTPNCTVADGIAAVALCEQIEQMAKVS